MYYWLTLTAILTKNMQAYMYLFIAFLAVLVCLTYPLISRNEVFIIFQSNLSSDGLPQELCCRDRQLMPTDSGEEVRQRTDQEIQAGDRSGRLSLKVL